MTDEADRSVVLTPSDFVEVVNQTLEYAYSSVVVVGEVASFKINQGKWVFFDLKDEGASVGCFMTLYQLRMPLEDGMKVMVRGVPKLTRWGKFSFTVQAVRPVGKGSLKKAFEVLKKKLDDEGLFDAGRKRPIPDNLTRLGVISSTAAAGYADFIKIINARWGGMRVVVAQTGVQGLDAPDQMIRALQYFNERGDVQMIAILRGGGSADDLACFNDEALVRAVAASKIPIITGIGHEVDESLCDLAADVRASTPSNAAELLTPDRDEELLKIRRALKRSVQAVLMKAEQAERMNSEKVQRMVDALEMKYLAPILGANRENMQKCLTRMQDEAMRMAVNLKQKQQLLAALNPESILERGYAILSGRLIVGDVVKITTSKQEIKAMVKEVYER